MRLSVLSKQHGFTRYESCDGFRAQQHVADFATTYRVFSQELSCRVDRAVTPFLVIALHPPLYHSSESHRFEPDTMMVRFAIEPLLLSVGVDLVIAGHVHAYEVTQPISHGDVDECDGIVHVTVGTGCVAPSPVHCGPSCSIHFLVSCTQRQPRGPLRQLGNSTTRLGKPA